MKKAAIVQSDDNFWRIRGQSGPKGDKAKARNQPVAFGERKQNIHNENHVSVSGRKRNPSESGERALVNKKHQPKPELFRITILHRMVMFLESGLPQEISLEELRCHDLENKSRINEQSVGVQTNESLRDLENDLLISEMTLNQFRIANDHLRESSQMEIEDIKSQLTSILKRKRAQEMKNEDLLKFEFTRKIDLANQEIEMLAWEIHSAKLASKASVETFHSEFWAIVNRYVEDLELKRVAEMKELSSSHKLVTDGLNDVIIKERGEHSLLVKEMRLEFQRLQKAAHEDNVTIHQQLRTQLDERTTQLQQTKEMFAADQKAMIAEHQSTITANDRKWKDSFLKLKLRLKEEHGQVESSLKSHLAAAESECKTLTEKLEKISNMPKL